MSSLSRELVFLILQFLDEEKFKETVHKLEQESGFFFNMKYFEDQVQGGEWEEVERYLSGFTKVDDNRYSMKIFFEIRKQKYLEALDKQDRAKAVDILVKDLKVFSSFNEELYKEITQLLTLENFRENEQLSKYGDTKSARNIMLLELKKLIEANPLFRDKLAFPSLKASRLRTLINQSLNWQHQLCKNPRPNPDIKTLFLDHTCGPPNGARAPPTTNPLVGGLPKQGTFPPLGTHSPFQPAPPSASALAGWMANPNPPAPQVPVANGPAALTAPPNPATLLKRPRTPPSSAAIIDYQSADSEHLMKRARPGVQPVDEVKTVNYAGGPSHPPNNASPDDLPKNVARSFNQGSCVMSMDFHPIQQTVLLVGTNVGDIGIWDVGSREKLAQRTFKVWDITVASMPMQAALVKDPAVSVNRTVWSPDGTLLGVAFSKHIVHIYTYNGGSDLRQHLEIDAHVGGVNDLAFSHPNKQLCVITCGDDKTIKVWDAATGRKQYTFEGHEAPVYSVCPHHKESIQFIFSTAIDGKIKAWLYDLLGSRVDYDAPGHWCTTMAYSADGTRLFSCGTSKDGESYLVEWNESEGAIKRTYSGFRKRSSGVVQFDTTRNRFLAAGDEFQIKFWDMDNTNLLTTIDADGGLPASPRLRFNKEGSLLAVTASDNGIKILANRDGVQMLRGLEARAYDANRGPAEPAVSKPPVGNALGVVSTPGGGGGGDRPNSSSMAGTGMDGPTLNMGGSRVRPRDRVGIDHSGMDGGRTPETKPRIPDEIPDRSKSWKLTEINEPSQCRSTRLPDTLPPNKVARLIYTNAGVALLALASNAVHKLWKWQRNERNPSGKATASVAPALWQPASGILMTNDISETNPEEAVPCIALSKNDSYVMSASGGKVSLFNMMTFKVMTTFMPPPPAATFLAFHPQDNNIIAIGMEDSTIQIYNVRVDEVKSKLKGHQKRITGLAFSNSLNVLVSSGADAQLCMWGTDGWEKRKSKFVQAQPGGRPPSSGDTRVQFHNDQVRLLVVHESQLAVYDASKLDRIRQWVPQSPFAAAISNATYSCDSQLVYTGFVDGSVGVFDAETLRPRCRLAPSVHIPQGVSGSTVYPLVIAAHPAEPNQFALGLSDGGVQVIEPLESEGKWGTGPPADNGAASGVPSGPASGNQGSDQTPRTPASPLAARSAPPTTAATLDYYSADSHLTTRPGVQPVDEVTTVNYFATGPGRSQDDMPKDVVRYFKLGSSIMCMDFHPIQQTLLVVGTNVGDIGIWEVGLRATLLHRIFAVWNITILSTALQAAMINDPAVSVNRTVWSPDGTFLGVAFSKHIVHIYTYNGGNDLRQHLEIDAHVGGVNDLAFFHPNKQLCVITCGDDKTIKVWDAATGRKQHTFEGHEAPVYSVSPHPKESFQFILSTAIDGTIKGWLYGDAGSILDFDAPGHWCTTMAYSADGTRFFSCGTSRDRKCYMVEWNESLGAIQRTYSGFREPVYGVVQVDTTRNRFLAAGDDFQIKFWDMDNTKPLTTTYAEGGLPPCPRLRFNKEGSLLAVISSDDGIIILANSDGIQMLRGLEARDYDALDGVNTVNYFATFPSHPQDAGGPSHSQDDLPKDVARSFKIGSCVMSMDFHPIQQTVLVVGTNVGDIGIWEVGLRETLLQRTFAVWNITVLSTPLQAALDKHPAVSVSVRKTVWSPDGTFLGVAFSEHLVHIYTYDGGADLWSHLEIDAHVGGVNDLAFSYPDRQLLFITCGDDKTIKVWDAATGRKQHTFEGHEAPVYSVCPHPKESIQFILSTAIDGTIKGWLYGDAGSILVFDAPGHWCTTMAYSADGTRLFSCGTSRDRKCYMVEWNESLGAFKRTYSGFRQRVYGVVQVDTTRNRFLAAGDDFQIKFWDMDNTKPLTTTYAEGGLPESPSLRFNKEGSLLAVSTSDNGIKVLCNSDGFEMLRGLEGSGYEVWISEFLTRTRTSDRALSRPVRRHRRNYLCRLIALLKHRCRIPSSPARFDRRSPPPSVRSCNAPPTPAPASPRSLVLHRWEVELFRMQILLMSDSESEV